MKQNTKLFLFLLRVSIGWVFFYAGISKIMDPAWSAAGYLTHAATFSGFYNWLASPGLLTLTNLVNEWGLLLLGVSLILGLGVRVSAILGAIIMLLYYLPVLKFPIAGPHSYIVDEHIIYIFVLLSLWALKAGRIWGLDRFFGKES
jgi:thiosulfate dehydrogenase [quinone] large subunit